MIDEVHGDLASVESSLTLSFLPTIIINMAAKDQVQLPRAKLVLCDIIKHVSFSCLNCGANINHLGGPTTTYNQSKP
jgi:hypothetical protein